MTLEFFEVGDRTALICDDGPSRDQLQATVEGLEFKCHVAESAERALEQLTYMTYDLIVIAEGFAGSTRESNSTLSYLARLPMAQRRDSYVVLIGDSYRTLDAMQAFSESVHLVVNPTDMSNFEAILKKGLADFGRFYAIFKTVLSETGEGG
jgi:CheY-like chemotaxis protein